jgi:phage terminase small subunit
MGFSSKIKAHKNKLTLEMLRFISEYLMDHNARQAALRAGIPETYAARYGQWLKKQPLVVAALEAELNEEDFRRLQKSLSEIDRHMDLCREILGLEAT